MKNIFVLISCIYLFSCKAHSQSKTMDKELIEAFDTIKNKVDIERYGTSLYNRNFEVINFKYIEATKTIHWTTILRNADKPFPVIVYTITYPKKNTILFWKGDLVLKNSNPEYKSIITAFITDAEALKQHQKQVLNEIKNGEIVKLKISQIVKLKNGLSLMLRGFSNKRVYPGDPRTAMAHMQVIIDDVTKEEISFYDHALAGIPYPNDTEKLKGYVFRIRKFLYDECIEVLVSKK